MPEPEAPPRVTCTCNHTAEEMDAASSPWHREGCPIEPTRGCPNCQGRMVLLCDPRMGLEWFHCLCCGHVEAP